MTKYFVSKWSGIYPLIAYISTVSAEHAQAVANKENGYCIEEPFEGYTLGIEIPEEEAIARLEKGQAILI